MMAKKPSPPPEMPKITHVRNSAELSEFITNLFGIAKPPSRYTAAFSIEPECWKVTFMVYDMLNGQAGAMDFMTIEVNFDVWMSMTQLNYRGVIQVNGDNTSQIRVEYPYGDGEWKSLLRQDMETTNGTDLLNAMYELMHQFPKTLLNQGKAN